MLLSFFNFRTSSKLRQIVGKEQWEALVAEKAKYEALKVIQFLGSGSKSQLNIRFDQGNVSEEIYTGFKKWFAQFLVFYNTPQNIWSNFIHAKKRGYPTGHVRKTYELITQSNQRLKGSFTYIPIYFIAQDYKQNNIKTYTGYDLVIANFDLLQNTHFSFFVKQEGQEMKIDFSVVECSRNCSLEQLKNIIHFSRSHELNLQKIVLQDFQALFGDTEKINNTIYNLTSIGFKDLITVLQKRGATTIETTVALAGISTFTQEQLEFFLKNNSWQAYYFEVPVFPVKQNPKSSLQVIFDTLWIQDKDYQKCITISELFLRYGASLIINNRMFSGVTVLENFCRSDFSNVLLNDIKQYLNLLIDYGSDVRYALRYLFDNKSFWKNYTEDERRALLEILLQSGALFDQSAVAALSAVFLGKFVSDEIRWNGQNMSSLIHLLSQYNTNVPTMLLREFWETNIPRPTKLVIAYNDFLRNLGAKTNNILANLFSSTLLWRKDESYIKEIVEYMLQKKFDISNALDSLIHQDLLWFPTGSLVRANLQLGIRLVDLLLQNGAVPSRDLVEYVKSRFDRIGNKELHQKLINTLWNAWSQAVKRKQQQDIIVIED